MKKFQATVAGIAAAALLAGCTSVGIPGFGDNSGCRTIYVYRGSTGDIQPVSSCADSLPRDRLMVPETATLSATVDPEQSPVDGEQPAAQVTPVSAAALAASPVEPPASYPGPNEMLEN